MEKREHCIRRVLVALFVTLAAVFAWVVLEEHLLKIFDEHLLLHLTKLTFSAASTGLFLGATLIVVVAIGWCFWVGYRLHYGAFMPLVVFVAVYVRLRYQGRYYSTPNLFCEFGYSDVAVFLLALFLLSCLVTFFRGLCRQTHRRQEQQRQGGAILFDRPITKAEDDLLLYSKNARQLAKILKNELDEDVPFSIGLMGKWGEGKSSYVNLLEHHLGNDFIIVKFTPRYSRHPEDIQGDFFETLFSTLRRYDSRFSSSFKRYLRAIDIIVDRNITHQLLSIHKVWDKAAEKEKINNAIRRLKKRVVVFIDDLDRLLADEIIEVFKLIDGNASFTNLIFITAYDKVQMNKIITKVYSNEGAMFSAKFFTMEWLLPLVPYDKIHAYLADKMCLVGNEEYQQSCLKVLSNHKTLTQRHIATFRDAKRFLNLFSSQYHFYHGKVEFKDFFLLQLIKYKYLDEYMKLYNMDYVSTNIIKSTQNILFLNDDVHAESKPILEILFPSDTSELTLWTINNANNFRNYFYDIAFYEGIAQDEMTQLLTSTSLLDGVKSKIDTFAQRSQINELLFLLNGKNLLECNDKASFEHLVDILLYIFAKDYDRAIPWSKMLAILAKDEAEQIYKRYGYSSEGYKKLISDKLAGSYPDYLPGITQGVIIGVIDNEFPQEIIFTKDEVLNIAKAMLNGLIANDPIIKDQHMQLLYSCIDLIDPESRIITLDQEVCKDVRVLVQENPEWYLDNFVRLGMISSNPDHNTVACEPFWKQIFGNAETFEAFINSEPAPKTSKIDRVRNFWKLYKNNDYKPIPFNGQGNVQEKIDKNLVAEAAALNNTTEA